MVTRPYSPTRRSITKGTGTITSSTGTKAGIESCNGFEIIGTTPKGFRHPQLVFVDTYVMYRSL